MKELTNHTEVNCMICHFKIQILAGFIWESIRAFFPISASLPPQPENRSQESHFFLCTQLRLLRLREIMKQMMVTQKHKGTIVSSNHISPPSVNYSRTMCCPEKETAVSLFYLFCRKSINSSVYT